MKISLSEKLGSITFWRKLRISKDFYVYEYMDYLNQLEKNRKVNSIFFNRITDKISDQVVEFKKVFKMKNMKNIIICI